MESNLNTILPVLDSAGVEYRREAGRVKMCCPFHDEKTPSFFVFDNNSCFCFGCQKFCWHDELVAHLCNCSIVEAKKKLGTYDPTIQYSPTDKPTGEKISHYDFADEPLNCSDSWAKLDDEVPEQMKTFLSSKGLWDSAYDLGLWRWCPKNTFKCWSNKCGICIPYFRPDGEVCTYRLREWDNMRQKFGHSVAPRGVSLQCSYLMYNSNDPVFFCEGESDSMSMYSLGYNVICIPGVGAHKQINSAIMTCLDWGVPEMVFCGDNDEAGKKMNEYCKNALYDLSLGLYKTKMSVLKLPEEFNARSDGSFKRKDINDFLVEGRLKELVEARNRTPASILCSDLPDSLKGSQTLSQSEIEGIFND